MKNFDLIVVGGGLAGVAAAISSARAGLNVLLIERTGVLGGAPVNCLVGPFMNYWTTINENGKNKRLYLCQGIFKEILDLLRIYNAIDEDEVTFHEEYLKLILDRIIENAGVTVLLHSYVIDAVKEYGKIMSVMVTNTEGKQNFGAKYFIDATGDANLSVMCGCRYQLGRKEDNRCQPMTLCFRITNIDVDGVHKSIHDINRLYKQYQQMGKIKNCRENVLMFRNIIENTMHFNSTSVIGCNPVDAFELSQAERTAREQMFELFDFLKTNFKCFEKSEIMMSASQIGIRESRMIDGEYVLCGDDIRQCKKNFVTQ